MNFRHLTGWTRTIEEKFDVHVPFNANDQELAFETVSDVVRAVQVLIEEAGGSVK